MNKKLIQIQIDLLNKTTLSLNSNDSQSLAIIDNHLVLLTNDILIKNFGLENTIHSMGIHSNIKKSNIFNYLFNKNYIIKDDYSLYNQDKYVWQLPLSENRIITISKDSNRHIDFYRLIRFYQSRGLTQNNSVYFMGKIYYFDIKV